MHLTANTLHTVENNDQLLRNVKDIIFAAIEDGITSQATSVKAMQVCAALDLRLKDLQFQQPDI